MAWCFGFFSCTHEEPIETVVPSCFCCFFWYGFEPTKNPSCWHWPQAEHLVLISQADFKHVGITGSSSQRRRVAAAKMSAARMEFGIGEICCQLSSVDEAKKTDRIILFPKFCHWVDATKLKWIRLGLTTGPKATTSNLSVDKNGTLGINFKYSLDGNNYFHICANMLAAK